MAETVTPHAWRSRRSTHSSTSTTEQHLPPEVADAILALAETVNAQAIRLHDLEQRTTEVEAMRQAMLSWLDDVRAIKSRGAA